MRRQAVLHAVVIGLTAFFSMLSRPENQDRDSLESVEAKVKASLSIRSKIYQLHKLSFDSFILCQSHSLGVLTSRIESQKKSESQLLTAYNQHIHMLYVNKKIKSETQYSVFDGLGAYMRGNE